MAEITREAILKSLEEIKDPEYKTSIVEMGFIDDVLIDDGRVEVRFHLNSPYAPGMYVIMIARDIRRNVSRLEGVESVKALITRHEKADIINREGNIEPLGGP